MTRRVKLRPRERRVLSRMDGLCFAVRGLAEIHGVSEKDMHRLVDAMIERGLLERVNEETCGTDVKATELGRHAVR